MSIIIGGFIVAIVLGYLQYRNIWLYGERQKMAYTDPQRYTEMPGYLTMMFRYFYIWDITKIKAARCG